jgi:hypothetical protein
MYFTLSLFDFIQWANAFHYYWIHDPLTWAFN